MQDRSQLFDSWAGRYDASLSGGDGDFPFAGYERVLDEAVSLANVQPGMRVLDLGIGTGNLAARFLDRGCAIWGIDFSTEMLAKARAKLPEAMLVQADLLGEWPATLSSVFDRVVSAYVLHEFPLEAKLALLSRLAANALAPEGAVVVADIAFPTALARAEAARRLAPYWDDDESYWAADETLAAGQDLGLQVTYTQVSFCGGVFVFRRGCASGVRAERKLLDPGQSGGKWSADG